jgi:hypothetical protein
VAAGLRKEISIKKSAVFGDFFVILDSKASRAFQYRELNKNARFLSFGAENT